MENCQIIVDLLVENREMFHDHVSLPEAPWQKPRLNLSKAPEVFIEALSQDSLVYHVDSIVVTRQLQVHFHVTGKHEACLPTTLQQRGVQRAWPTKVSCRVVPGHIVATIELQAKTFPLPSCLSDGLADVERNSAIVTHATQIARGSGWVLLLHEIPNVVP